MSAEEQINMMTDAMAQAHQMGIDKANAANLEKVKELLAHAKEHCMYDIIEIIEEHWPEVDGK